jgi:hypothetical protein
MTLIAKDPDARIDFEFDWHAACPEGQGLIASQWTVVPGEAAGVVVTGAAQNLMRSTVTLAGGIAGHVYRVTNRITLSDGQIDERSMTVRVEER